jgi:transcriptional regulator with XRE-family HTH domain
MSTDVTSVGVPDWDLADRMRKALRVSGVSAIEMSAYLGVSRNTISNWINGHTPPPTMSVRLWALRTGVPYEWLRGGEIAAQGSTGSSNVIPFTTRHHRTSVSDLDARGERAA